MSFDEEIKKEFALIQKKELEVKEAAKKLEPKVLEHFNQYVRNVINPILPEGHFFEDSKEIHFYRGYVINLGGVVTPNGIRSRHNYLPNGCEYHPIMDLCYKYTDNHPWMERIEFSFALGK
ncbi:MAG: hypothetical protein WC413_01825 [Candidatus Nanoarchaeia archaeon]